jgi:hypothetical protein
MKRWMGVRVCACVGNQGDVRLGRGQHVQDRPAVGTTHRHQTRTARPGQDLLYLRSKVAFFQCPGHLMQARCARGAVESTGSAVIKLH